ncbi:MAG: HD domain-containing protein [Actinomycetota bacterium]|nr:HD domain-containing protein [Actinomycetota bacterium]
MTSRTPLVQDPGGGSPVLELLRQARDVESVDIGRSRGLVQQARVVARSMQDVPGEAEALYRLSELSYASGLSNEAFALAIEARDLAAACGAIATQVAAVNLIAAVQYHSGNFSEALACAYTALELYRSTGERVSEGLLLNSIAVIQHNVGDTDRAIVTYEAALMANKGQNRPDLDAITLANMAKVRADRHEDLLAVSLGESALVLAKVHVAEFVPEILARLALAYVTLAALDRAASCLHEADGVLRDRTERRVALSPGSVVTVRLARGELYVAQHLRDHALREWDDALVLATRANMAEVALLLHEKLAGLCKTMGRFDQALVHQEARYALNEEIINRGMHLRITTLQTQYDTERTRQQAEILRLRTTDLEQMVMQRTDPIEAFQFEALLRIATLAEFRSLDAVNDLQRVGELAGDMAAELGCDSGYVERLRRAACLHDIGKIALPDMILMKPSTLTVGEFEVVKGHAADGAAVLSGSATPVVQLAEEVALTHHERWDGTGYPAGLAGDDIPLSGRIVAIADTYDALISARVYKRAWSPLEAVHCIVDGHSTHFDPRLVDAFVKVILRRHPSLAAGSDQPPPA